MTLEEAREHVGDGVIYHPAHARGGQCEIDAGVITSVNSRYAFVRYSAGGSKATSPADLTLDDEPQGAS